MFTLLLFKGSGNFEITEGLSLVATGKIKVNESSKMTTLTRHEILNSIKLQEKDFYKEMRLRGYYHSDLFRAVVESTNNGLEGKIKWNSEWTTFIDCLLQFQVLTKDTRMLVLPTKFRKLIINVDEHRNILSEADDQIVDVVTCPYLRIIKAGGVEIHEFEGRAVNRRPTTIDPVLEAHKFIPHFPATPVLSKKDAAKFCVQILLENSPTARIVSVEIDSNDNIDPMSEYIYQGLSDLPTITSELNYLSEKPVTIENVNVRQGELSEFQNVNFIIKTQCHKDEKVLKLAKSTLATGGFIISREPQDTKLPIIVHETLQLVATIVTEDGLILLLQFKKDDYLVANTIIKVTEHVDQWLEPLKLAVKSGSVLIYSQHDEFSGILGLVNCMRREYPDLKCVFIDDPTAPLFDVNHPFYELQLRLGLTINVYKNNQWGTYRHLQINNALEVKPRTEHCFANCLLKGDMSSIFWFNGPMESQAELNDLECIKVHYAAINFRDVMQASGKISFDFLNRIQQQCIIGFEFSGITNNGKRVAGIGKAGAFTTYHHPDNAIVFDVPDSWSLEEAVTMPLVYITVYIAFFNEVHIKSGQSVLIHAGSGGVGLAALHIAFHYGLNVFTTVSTEEKKNYLLNEFPLLKPEHVGNSRDTSFEEMILIQTKGKGVDYVLNSLSEEKLLASIRCVAENGTFLEIGKFDIINKTKIDMGFCSKKINIKTVFLQGTEQILSPYQSQILTLMKNDLTKGVIKPLKTTVFEASEIPQAFRYLASGKHIGKVLVKIRENESDIASLPLSILPRIFCDKSSSYILIGGLGGFGLELADWLVLRGCQKLVISSSRGITNGYQEARIKFVPNFKK